MIVEGHIVAYHTMRLPVNPFDGLIQSGAKLDLGFAFRKA
jgi:hypothetical protein